MPHLTAEDHAVVGSVKAAIDRLHRMGILYADIFSPLHDDSLAAAMRHLTILVRGAAIGEQDIEVVTPPVYGRYLLLYSTDIPVAARRFAKRHGMGHVIGGHVTEVNYLSSSRNDYMSYEERVADLFALADTVPFWQLDEMRHARLSWGAIKQELCRIIRRHTVNWPEDRVGDRAALRIALYRLRQQEG